MKAESQEVPTSSAIKLKKDIVDHLGEDLDKYDKDVENEKTFERFLKHTHQSHKT